MGEVLRDADAKLSDVRAAGQPDAGGLVLAADQEHARSIAERLGRICGERPDVVTSDELEASARIAAFSASRARWLVSVLMVSEGVDIPRLRVGVYATPARTELFFRQVVGRFIRRTPAPRRQMSYLLMPADLRLKRLAIEIEDERRHALELLGLGEEEGEQPERAERGEGVGFETLSSSGELDEAILSQTTLQLFSTGDEPPPPPSPRRRRRATTGGARGRLRLAREAARRALPPRRTGLAEDARGAQGHPCAHQPRDGSSVGQRRHARSARAEHRTAAARPLGSLNDPPVRRPDTLRAPLFVRWQRSTTVRFRNVKKRISIKMCTIGCGFHWRSLKRCSASGIGSEKSGGSSPR